MLLIQNHIFLFVNLIVLHSSHSIKDSKILIKELETNQAMKESNRNKSLYASIHKPPIDNGRSISMVVKVKFIFFSPVTKDLKVPNMLYQQSAVLTLDGQAQSHQQKCNMLNSMS